MAFFDKYPYTNFHNVNLDWVLERVKEYIGIAEKNNKIVENFNKDLLSFRAELINCFKNVAWTIPNADTYIENLEKSLYESIYPKIRAFYNQTDVVYDTYSLESLRTDLTVMYYENENSEGEEVTDYTLTGELTDGVSIITVRYEMYSTIFTVLVQPSFVVNPTICFGAPFASSTRFGYTPNTMRACMNPAVLKVESGLYTINFTAGSDYYYSLATINYDTSIYNPNFSFIEGVAKDFMTEGMSYTYPQAVDGSSGWLNTSKTFQINNVVGFFLNIKKGSAGTDNFTNTDIDRLNRNIIIRKVQ